MHIVLSYLYKEYWHWPTASVTYNTCRVTEQGRLAQEVIFNIILYALSTTRARGSGQNIRKQVPGLYRIFLYI